MLMIPAGSLSGSVVVAARTTGHLVSLQLFLSPSRQSWRTDTVGESNRNQLNPLE